ncbi:hypothetical protein DACRYDRAFT_83522 [Dacryopinax primogenitus]|uniref:Nucleolar protein 16 n=1 Tax=Dacryopinax primogenitus (strain DJM 731) TaxID=1858805 RepID=M5FPA9_DACPD|nr:uncharacterized protein DACRYDRAFT_83522 [Dacryopinax primogenitus]EJT98390.1 hypothetical protein DACRYDRAFT_83522 [Dacryopinax primogenitus]
MANPRQRRKARSSSHRTVKTSNAKKLRKHPAIKGPEVLKKAWDVHKTVRQNYAALGLAPTLSSHQSGGTEHAGASLAPKLPLPDEIEGINNQNPNSNPPPKPLRKGFGRIVRDENGNVVDVILAEEEEAAGAEAELNMDMDLDAGAVSQKRKGGRRKGGEETPWGAPMEDWAVTDQLDKLASEAINAKLPRHASANELELLGALLRKYGTDVERMARDGKLNRWQKTAGELRRALKKAGGEAAILAAADAAQAQTQTQVQAREA